MATFSISIAFSQPQKGCVGSLKLSQYTWTYVTNLPCFLFRTEFCISILVQNSNPGVVRSLLSLIHGFIVALGETGERRNFVVLLLKKRKNSTRILLPPFSNQHSDKTFDDFSNVRNGEKAVQQH